MAQADLRSVVRNYDRKQEEDQAMLLAAEKGLSYANLVNYPFVGDVLKIIPFDQAQTAGVVAFMKIGRSVRVASPNPFEPGLAALMNQIGQAQGLSFEPYVCSKASLDYALNLYPTLVPKEVKQKSYIEEQGGEDKAIKTLQDLQKAISQTSTTEILETLLQGAVVFNASDIHFEPSNQDVEVRFRIDGRLLPIVSVPQRFYRPISSRIKTAAQIKLDNNRTPQDGRMTIKVSGQDLDIRVNSIPTTFGETIVLRLLSYKDFLTFDQLGLNQVTRQAIAEAIAKPQGLILFTGPTGSGKTTSLYAALQLLNKPEKKIITIEDPVEYRLEGIEQIQVDPARGFDFAQALRGAMRQDPDIVMVGEIRDRETAEIAANASLTGHLVLSTLHTNNAASAYVRLIQMGVPKFLLVDSITLIVGQRLVRKICPNCQGQSCQVCHQTGFKGRVVIAEHYLPDSQTAQLIAKEASSSEFVQAFKAAGYKTMLEDGLGKVAQDITTEAEVKAVADY